jgi:Conserved hypothetical protein 2217 (DUF2460)
MTTFPTLKTGAVAQYPITKVFRFQQQILHFIDGTDQRYQDCAGSLYTWVIRLDQLDEGELAALQAFFLDNQGAFGSFSFTDPWSGQVYQNCSLESDEMDITSFAEMRGATSLTVIQNGG